MKGEIVCYEKEIVNDKILFRCHKGFDTLEDLKELLEIKKIDYSKCAVVYFLKSYYVVIFEGYDREYMIGKENVFYTDGNYIMHEATTKKFTPKFYPNKLKVQEYRHKQLYYDLLAIDKDIDVFIEDKSVVNTAYGKTYAILLGLTFMSTYFNRQNAYLLKDYFFDDYDDVFSNYDIYGINPFKGKVIHNDGKIRHFQFYKREIRYYNNYKKVVYLR